MPPRRRAPGFFLTNVSLKSRLRFACLAAVIGLPAAAIAHGPIHERIAFVSARIERDPSNAQLYVERGELEREHHDFKAALADFDRAAALDPHLTTLDLNRARAWFDAGDWRRARDALDRFLGDHPNHAAGRAMRARVRFKLGDIAPASEDYTHAIALRPDPDYYLERAHAQAAAGPASVGRALRGLDEGVAALGPVMSLQLAAIDLELGSKRYDAALARLDRILERAPRKEEWLARRGDILRAAGRRDEARATYQAALGAIAMLPAERRTTATTRLDVRLRAEMERPEAPK